MKIKGDHVSAPVASRVAIKQTQLHYTTDTGDWQKRQWQTVPAELHRNIISATLPPQRPLVCFLSVTDERGLRVSTEHEELYP